MRSTFIKLWMIQKTNCTVVSISNNLSAKKNRNMFGNSIIINRYDMILWKLNSINRILSFLILKAQVRSKENRVWIRRREFLSGCRANSRTCNFLVTHGVYMAFSCSIGKIFNSVQYLLLFPMPKILQIIRLGRLVLRWFSTVRYPPHIYILCY